MKRYGPHAVTNRSIDHPEVDDLAALTPVSILYSDPPWGDGNLRYWATMNEKMTGQRVAPLTYDALLTRLFGLVDAHVDGYVLLETGIRWEAQLADSLAERYHHVRTFRLRYRSGSKVLPSSLVVAGTTAAHRYAGDPTDRIGYDAVLAALQPIARAGATILDPCCGLGYTARAAIDLNLVFRGNELNAKRLRETEAKLERATRS